MKRPTPWFKIIFILCMVICFGGYLWLTWLVPHYVIQQLNQKSGGTIHARSARLEFPLTVKINDFRTITGTDQTILNVQQIVGHIKWISWRKKTIWLSTLYIGQPVVRTTRTDEGKFVWPNLEDLLAQSSAFSQSNQWRIHIDSLMINDGFIEFIDEFSREPFHGVIDHISFDAGPVEFPRQKSEMSFAFRTRLIDKDAHSAPFFGSGWLDRAKQDLQFSWQLSPLPLAAFSPYHDPEHGKIRIKLGESTLKITSQWNVESNMFDGNMQLEVDQMSAGAIMIRGAKILDVKELEEQERIRLSGEVKLTGLFDQPSDWRVEFVAAERWMEHIVKLLLGRNIEIVRVPFWGRRVPVNLAPSSEDTMTDIEARSKRLEEALEILVPAPAVEVVGVTSIPEPIIDEPIEQDAETAFQRAIPKPALQKAIESLQPQPARIEFTKPEPKSENDDISTEEGNQQEGDEALSESSSALSIEERQPPLALAPAVLSAPAIPEPVLEELTPASPEDVEVEEIEEIGEGDVEEPVVVDIEKVQNR